MRDGHGALVHVGHQGLQDVHVNVVQNQHRVSAGVVLNNGYHGHTNTKEHFWPAFVLLGNCTYRTLLDVLRMYNPSNASYEREC